VVAFCLRVANIGWGVPISSHTHFYHPDESKAYVSTLVFPQQYLSSDDFLYGTAIQYSIGLLLLPVKLLMVGVWSMPAEYKLTAIMFFRFCNVLMGTASVYLVYLLAGRLLDKRCGLIAAMLVSVALFHTLSSCLTTLEVGMSFLLLCCVLTCTNCLKARSLRSFFFAGLAAGMLLGTKVTGALFVGCVFLWLTFGSVRSAGASKAVTGRWRPLAIFLVTTGAVFAVTTPHVVLDFGNFWDVMMQQKSTWYDKAPTTPTGILYQWFDATSLAAGLPVAITCLPGALCFGKGRRRKMALAGLCVVVYYLFWRGYLPPRFVTAVVPILCLFSAALWGWFMARDRQWVRRASFAFVAMAIVWSLAGSVMGVTQRWLDARTVASRYIDRNLPRGSRIGIATDHNDHWTHHRWRYPRIDFEVHRDAHFLQRPEYIIVTSRELKIMRKALKSDRLRPDNLWNPAFHSDWYLNDPPIPAIFAFYRELFAGQTYEEVAAFMPWPPMRIVGAAPDVHLYRRREGTITNSN